MSFPSCLFSRLTLCLASAFLASVCGAAQESVGSAPEVLGQKFEKWTSSGGLKLASPESLFSPASLSGENSQIQVGAAYTPIPPPPSLTLSIQGKGNTSPAQGGKIEFKESQGQIKVLAKPDNYSKFDKWVCSGPVKVNSGEAIETLATVDGADATLTAVFSPVKGWLSTGTWGGGSISPTPGSNLVDVGAAQSLKATPADGYKFTKWSVSGDLKVEDGNSSGTAATLTGYNGRAVAVFTGWLQNFGEPLDVDPHYVRGKDWQQDIASFSIGVSGRGHTKPCPGPYVGEPCKLKLVAHAAKDSRFDRWNVSGKARVEDPESPETSVCVYGNSSVTAMFDPEYAFLRIKSGPGGAAAPKLKEPLKLKTGEPFEISASPAEGYKFEKWAVNGNAKLSSAQSPTCSITLKSDATVHAIFARDYAKDGAEPQQAQEAKAQERLGTLLSISSDGALLATPPEGYRFSSWRLSGGAKVENEFSPSSKLSFAKEAGSSSVSAVFAPDFANLSLAVSGEGSTKPSAGDAPLKVKVNSGVAVEALPAKLFKFAGWKASGGAKPESPESPKTSVTMSSNGSLTAVFEPDSAKLTVRASGGGAVEPSGAVSAQMSVPNKLEAKPDEGFIFVEWKTEGPVSVSGSRSLKAAATLSGDATVTAVFAPEWAKLTLAVSGEGRTNPESCKALEVKPGAWTQVEAIPAPGSAFANWTVQGKAELASPESAATEVKVSGGEALVIANLNKLPEKKASSAASASTTLATTPGTGAAEASGQRQGKTSDGSLKLSGDQAVQAGEGTWLVASDGTYADRVKLVWRKPNAALFEIWRALDGTTDPTFVKLIDSWPGQSYEDFSAEAGAVYVYKVVAKSRTGSSLGFASDSGYRRK